MKKIFYFGVGFSAIDILTQSRDAGYEVSGCVRSQDKADALNACYDFNVVTLDSLTAEYFSDVTHIVMSIPPARDDGSSYADYKVFVDSAVHLEWFGYLSTTGVYGDKQGGWVDENTPVSPSGMRGKYRVEAEAYWHSICDKVHVFRLPGIYGKGRSALDSVSYKGAKAVNKKDQVFSRIHTYDIAQTVVASMQQPRHGAVYNVVDDMATSPIAPLLFACDLLGITPVPIVDYDNAELSAMAKSFYADSKRVKNTLIKQELGVKLRYPTYLEGLQAIFDGL